MAVMEVMEPGVHPIHFWLDDGMGGRRKCGMGWRDGRAERSLGGGVGMLTQAP